MYQGVAVEPRNAHFISPGVVRRNHAAARQVRAAAAAAASAAVYVQLYDLKINYY